MSAYYNELDPYAAEWLRNLQRAGLITTGDIDDRSICDVHPIDLLGYTQCHFFAGIGVWSHALRLAGWPDDRPVWTGSCPCQPFSAAGKGAGVTDDRHLWPAWFNLIEKCKPSVVFGEQVEAAIRHGWLDLVQSDMEGIGYAVAAAGIPAAGFGAPHIRQRLWFVADNAAGIVADAEHARHCGSQGPSAVTHCDEQNQRVPDGDCAAGRLGNNNNKGLEGLGSGHQAAQRRDGAVRSAASSSESGGVADTNGGNAGTEREQRSGEQRQQPQDGGSGRPGPTNGHWRDADWLHCRDGKWRPVEPGTLPLAHGAAARVGRLRAYGNAIVPQVAAEVIAAFMECRP